MKNAIIVFLISIVLLLQLAFFNQIIGGIVAFPIFIFSSFAINEWYNKKKKGKSNERRS